MWKLLKIKYLKFSDKILDFCPSNSLVGNGIAILYQGSFFATISSHYLTLILVSKTTKNSEPQIKQTWNMLCYGLLLFFQPITEQQCSWYFRPILWLVERSLECRNFFCTGRLLYACPFMWKVGVLGFRG